MHIGDLARETGLPIDTIRFYEKIGLLPKPARTAGGRRIYDEGTLRWVDFLLRLKATGMGLAQMRTYAELRARGSSTASARRRLLEQHQAHIAQQIALLTENLTLLDEKIVLYRQMERESHQTETNGPAPFPVPL